MSAAEVIPEGTWSLDIDERRPWPLGLPEAKLVLEGIAGKAEVAERLQASHLRVLSMLPENLYEAARTNLAGTADPIAVATASAWRALVAAERSQVAMGVDQPALQALVDEAVDAREKIIAAGYFALDGGAGAEELLSELGVAIELLVEQAQFKAATRHKLAPAAGPLVVGEMPTTAEAARGKLLRAVFAVTMVVTISFHLWSFLSVPQANAWVVVGDVDSGHAFIAPGGGEAKEGSLQSFIGDLAAKGFSAAQSATGEWTVRRSEEVKP